MSKKQDNNNFFICTWPELLHTFHADVLAPTVAMHNTDNYRQTPNICRSLVGNKFVVHSDVVGASPVGAAPTTSSFLT